MIKNCRYKGRSLEQEHLELIKFFKTTGGSCHVTGSAEKTIRLIRGSRNYGYINETVLTNGVLGYRSPDSDEMGFKDACLQEHYDSAEKSFSKRYRTTHGWVRNPLGEPRNLNGRSVYYLIITDLELAKMVCG